jgi:hypothetical protein
MASASPTNALMTSMVTVAVSHYHPLMLTVVLITIFQPLLPAIACSLYWISRLQIRPRKMLIVDKGSSYPDCHGGKFFRHKLLSGPLLNPAFGEIVGAVVDCRMLRYLGDGFDLYEMGGGVYATTRLWNYTCSISTLDASSAKMEQRHRRFPLRCILYLWCVLIIILLTEMLMYFAKRRRCQSRRMAILDLRRSRCPHQIAPEPGPRRRYQFDRTIPFPRQSIHQQLVVHHDVFRSDYGTEIAAVSSR